jgi:hypothetical protein
LELVQPEYKTEVPPVRLLCKTGGKILSALMHEFAPRFVNLSFLQFLGIYYEGFSITKFVVFIGRDF